MRKGRRFTPTLIRNWEDKKERGQGTFSTYKPWHQVSRSDPCSIGRSHLVFCPRSKRHMHFLSDVELAVYGFALMLPGGIDIKEQYKLEIDSHENALSRYSIKKSKFNIFGTVQICEQLKIKHPTLYKGEVKEVWRFSTDFLITLKNSNNDLKLLAVAVKQLSELKKIRKCNLLRVEKNYWKNEDVDWLLITEENYNSAVRDTVIRVLPYVTHAIQIDIELKFKCAALSSSFHKKSLKDGLSIINREFNVDINYALLIFWQTVWAGLIPLDLTISRYVSDTVNLISVEQFWEQNPIFSRRTTCL